jgi:hypothetical protein
LDVSIWAVTARAALQVVKMLDAMRIGTLPEGERVIATTDPYANEPKRSERIIARTTAPFNGETPLDALLDHITTNEMHFKRNHMPVPEVPLDAFELQVCLFIMPPMCILLLFAHAVHMSLSSQRARGTSVSVLDGRHRSVNRLPVFPEMAQTRSVESVSPL